MKPYPTTGPDPDTARRRTRPASTDTPQRSQPDQPVATIKGPVVFTGEEARHLRGLPVTHYGGVSPNTRPDRTYCTECGIRSGQHHHRACSWNGLLP